MKLLVLTLSMIVVMMFCSIAIVHAQSANGAVTAQDVKKETQDLINTLQQYTADQRDQAVKAADQALTRLDRRIDELETKVDNNWDNMTQAARQKVRTNLKALRQQRNELAELYGSFKTSSTDAWDQMKKGFTDAYQAIIDSWEKAKSEYDKENMRIHLLQKRSSASEESQGNN